MRTRLVALACTGVAVLVGVGTPSASALDEGGATGANGQSLSVSTASGLPRSGSTEVTVTGAGFDETKGIYVAVCVVPKPGETPTPCLGGVDTSGGSGLSAWISSNPPSYGEGLATAYGDGGSFELVMEVEANDGVTNCLSPKDAPRGCAVVSRADHTRTDDRSQDVLVPLTFGSGSAAESPAAAVPTAAARSTDSADTGSSTAVIATDSDESMPVWQLVLIGAGLGLILCAAYVLGTRSRGPSA